MELIAELEREKRGVYAGAVGYFGYNTIKADGTIEEGGMDTSVIFRLFSPTHSNPWCVPQQHFQIGFLCEEI